MRPPDPREPRTSQVLRVSRRKPPQVPPLGLTEHPRRTVLVLQSHLPAQPEAVDGYAIQPAAGLDALRELARVAPPSTVVLVRTRDGDSEAEEMRELIRVTPSVPVVAAVAFREATAAQVRALLDSGVAEIASVDESGGLRALVPTLRRAHARPLKRRIEERLPAWVPEDARTLIRAAAETVVDLGGREVFAGIFGVYVRTAADWCRELDLPPPRRLLGWVRVLLALTLLEEAHRTVISVALACGYKDNSSLKRAIENFIGTPALPSIRDQRFVPAFDRFADELRALRHDAQGRRRRTVA
jgi:AraC-like DNA-binding protein